MIINLILFLGSLLFIYYVWRVRILLIKIGLKVYPEVTKVVVLKWFVKLLLTRRDREIIAAEMHNEHMVRLYSTNVYLYWVPDNKKNEILDEYRSRLGLDD